MVDLPGGKVIKERRANAIRRSALVPDAPPGFSADVHTAYDRAWKQVKAVPIEKRQDHKLAKNFFTRKGLNWLEHRKAHYGKILGDLEKYNVRRRGDSEVKKTLTNRIESLDSYISQIKGSLKK